VGTRDASVADVTPVVVAGALANKPGSGGEAWVRLSWVRGLRLLGLDVWFVEELQSESCVDECGGRTDPVSSVNVEWFRRVVGGFDLEPRASLLVDGETLIGASVDRLVDLASSSVLVNISGHLRDDRLFPAFRRRVMVDIDPGFTQFWHAMGESGARIEGHDRYFTIGENIGRSSCTIPTGGLAWRPVRQPVVLDDWPVTPPPETVRFTTVANWRGPFGRIDFDGRSFGLKVHEFRKFVTLPREVPYDFELALNIHPDDDADLGLLHRNGWRTVEPSEACGDPSAFRSYVQGSSAEYSVAQGIYVDTRCGWFSDRSVRYLASGRPVLVQDTGFDRTLPTGVGLLTFSSLADAATGAENIVTDYEAHAAAARDIAARFFGADVVLGRFCDEAGIGHG
jgi:hypothetical protein